MIVAFAGLVGREEPISADEVLGFADSEFTVLNRGDAPFSEIAPYSNASFDGTNWLVGYTRPRPLDAGLPYGGPVFLARLTADGTILETEEEALLAAPGDTALSATVARTGASPIVAWRDGRDSISGPHSVYAQAVAP